MQKSILTIDKSTTKSDFLLRLTSELKKSSSEVYLNIVSLPSFLDTKVSFTVFFSSLRNFPKKIIWTTPDQSINQFLGEIEHLNQIAFTEFESLTGEKVIESVGYLKPQSKTLEMKVDSVRNLFLTNNEKSEINKISLENVDDIDYNYNLETVEKSQVDSELPIQEKIEPKGFRISNFTSEVEESNLNKLDNLIEKLEKTKIDLSKKGKYPLELSSLNKMKESYTFLEKLMPLSSVSSSILFIIVLVVICFVILLQLFPLS
jgi:hypothetical protein